MKQSHTKQVEEVMKGCGKIEYFSNWNADYKCPFNLEGKFYLCDNCKSIHKGMQIAIQNELDFLESKKKMVCSIEGCGREDKTFTAYCIKHGRSFHHIEFEDRITDCKNALTKIKEVIKMKKDQKIEKVLTLLILSFAMLCLVFIKIFMIKF